MYKTELEGDPGIYTFVFMQLFDWTQPGGPAGSSKARKRGPFPVSINKSLEFGGLA